MIKISLNFALKTLDGVAIDNTNAGKILANILVNTKHSDPLKSLSLAERLYEKGEIEIDQSDYEYIERALRSSDNADLGVGQILRAMKEGKDKK